MINLISIQIHIKDNPDNISIKELAEDINNLLLDYFNKQKITPQISIMELKG